MTKIECELDTTCKHRDTNGICKKDKINLADGRETEWKYADFPCDSV